VKTARFNLYIGGRVGPNDVVSDVFYEAMLERWKAGGDFKLPIVDETGKIHHATVKPETLEVSGMTKMIVGEAELPDDVRGDAEPPVSRRSGWDVIKDELDDVDFGPPVLDS
jgi:hypothetical protein